MLLALHGALVIVGRDVFEHPSLGWGDLLSIGSSLFYAAYLLNTQKVRQRTGTLSFMWLSSVSATTLLLLYVGYWLSQNYGPMQALYYVMVML